MDLIIVESPTKAKTLNKFLNGKYKIEATMGHIRDLPKSELGVDIEHDFKPGYVTPRERASKVKELKKIASESDSVILATDPDREGEAIAWHVANVLNQSSKLKTQKSIDGFKRIAFHEITETAIKEALDNPRKIDMQLVDAQQARRVLDRLVGYKLSPLLWQKLSRKWLSAGRVQSVTVRLIVEREREINAFKVEPYFTVTGLFKPESSKSSEKSIFPAELVSHNGDKYEKKITINLFDGSYTTSSTTITTKEQADRIIADIEKSFTVNAVDKKELKRTPPPPFTTSTLQQEAARRLHYSAKKTMQVAQRLYEEGVITYHRTDSVNLSDKFIEESKQYIKSKFGEKYLPNSPRKYQTKSKVAQEAHEAIRPTNPKIEASEIMSNESFNRDHLHLYELIWKRAVASQMQNAVFDSTTIVLETKNGYRFETQGSVIKFDGFLIIIGRETDEKILPAVAVGDKVIPESFTPVAHTSNPPPRYTESSLVKALEEKDIGRPSTYAPIISTILDRNYVEKIDKALAPTDLGNSVTDFLVNYFPNILNLPFTATLEGSLDEIATGTKKWVPVVSDFYKEFSVTLNNAYKNAQKVKMAVEETDQKCPLCGSPIVIRMGKYGRFLACSTFPKCNYTKQVVETIDVKCPKCGGQIVVKKSRRGKSFYGCSNYPKCTFAAWKKEDIK